MRMRPAAAKRTAALNTSIPRTPWWLPQNGSSSPVRLDARQQSEHVGGQPKDARLDLTHNELAYSRAVWGKKNVLIVLLSPEPDDVPSASNFWNYAEIASDYGGSPHKWVDNVVRSSALPA